MRRLGEETKFLCHHSSLSDLSLSRACVPVSVMPPAARQAGAEKAPAASYAGTRMLVCSDNHYKSDAHHQQPFPFGTGKRRRGDLQAVIVVGAVMVLCVAV